MPTPEENKIYEDMGRDPEVHDENDPAYAEEMFKTMKALHQNPDDLIDPKDRTEYLVWLKEKT